MNPLSRPSEFDGDPTLKRAAVRPSAAAVSDVEQPDIEHRETEKLPAANGSNGTNGHTHRPATLLIEEATTTPLTSVAVTGNQAKKPEKQRWRIKSTLVALVVFIFINVVVQLFSYQLANANDPLLNFYRLRRCEALGQHIDAIYLGTSHEYDAIDPMTLDAAAQQQYGTAMTSCNLATIGSTLEANYFMLKKYLEDGNTPKAVVVGLWERNFNINGESNQDFFNDPTPIVRDSDLSDLPDVAWQFQHTPHTYYDLISYVAQKTIPVYGMRNGILRKLCGSNTQDICAVPPEMTPWIGNAYHGANAKNWTDYISADRHMTAPYNPKTDPAYVPLPSPNVLKNYQIGGPEIHYLNELLDLLNAHHITPILEVAPFEETFFHWFPDPNTWTTILGFYRSEAQQHHAYLANESRFKGVTYLDFFDVQHLNDQGAFKYSKFLGTNVMYPILHGLPPDASVYVPTS